MKVGIICTWVRTNLFCRAVVNLPIGTMLMRGRSWWSTPSPPLQKRRPLLIRERMRRRRAVRKRSTLLERTTRNHHTPMLS